MFLKYCCHAAKIKKSPNSDKKQVSQNFNKNEVAILFSVVFKFKIIPKCQKRKIKHANVSIRILIVPASKKSKFAHKISSYALHLEYEQ